jgi:tripartite-type tricarboxylate transporter receptor subunit TctC
MRNVVCAFGQEAFACHSVSMKLIVTRIVRLAAVIAFLAGGPAVAQNGSSLDYPTRTVKIVVPFPAGGVPDVLCRILAQALAAKWGQPVVVENRGGGNTIVGTTSVIRSAPDGYTLLFTTDGTFILNPVLYPALPYSADDLVPISLVATSAHAFAVNKAVPVQSVKDFIALAKAKPQRILLRDHWAGQHTAHRHGAVLAHRGRGTSPCPVQGIGRDHDRANR